MIFSRLIIAANLNLTLKFGKLSFIIIFTWPVSQTVKTLRSQRREYGFESHTGHQSGEHILCSFLIYTLAVVWLGKHKDGTVDLKVL